MTTSEGKSSSQVARSPLIERAIDGDRRALARLISRIERDDADGRALVDRIYPRTGKAHRVGVTGPPGAGKSSLIDRLIGAYRGLGRRVGVICVDPTSPLSGGATLGDRIRLMDYHADPGVYVRSMASRGHHGGLAATTASVAHVLDAVGFDPILIETLGVGQDEVEIAHLAHTVVVLQVPNLGDTVQTLKAGILEIADVLVVNKADLPDADRLFRDLAAMLSLADRSAGAGSQVAIVRTSAPTGAGVDELLAAIDDHRRRLTDGGSWQDRQRTLAAAELSLRLRAAIDERLVDRRQGTSWTDLVDDVAARRRTPYESARQLFGTLKPEADQSVP